MTANGRWSSTGSWTQPEMRDDQAVGTLTIDGLGPAVTRVGTPIQMAAQNDVLVVQLRVRKTLAPPRVCRLLEMELASGELEADIDSVWGFAGTWPF